MLFKNKLSLYLKQILELSVLLAFTVLKCKLQKSYTIHLKIPKRAFIEIGRNFNSNLEAQVERTGSPL